MAIERASTSKGPDRSFPKSNSLGSARSEAGISGLQGGASEIPFTVRGHHITALIDFTLRDQSPEEYAVETVVTLNENLSSPFPSVREYAADRIGDTPETGDIHRAGVEAFLEEYKALEPDSPISIVANAEDAICRSCAVGDHCLPSEHGRYGDGAYLAEVSKVAHRLGMGDDISITASPDGVPQSLTTSANTLKATLNEIGTIKNRAKFESRYEEEHIPKN